jgi:hypothetical protein
MKRRQYGPSLIERALIEKQWHATALEATVQALVSDDSARMVNAAGKILYVVLGACIAEEADENDPAMVAVREAVDAVHDQAGLYTVPPERRARIVAGLDVCGFLVSVLDRKNLIAAACELHAKLARGQYITTADFERLLKREVGSDAH